VITLSNKEILEEIERNISDGKTVELKVTGGSMRPYLRSGKDIVVLSPYRDIDLKPGAIVLFRYNNNPIFHRIIRIEKDNFTMQGDGICNRYEEVLKRDVIGIVNQIIRTSGKTISTHSFFSMAYWLFWRFAHPIRKYILALYDLCKK